MGRGPVCGLVGRALLKREPGWCVGARAGAFRDAESTNQLYFCRLLGPLQLIEGEVA
jgi:hypothetical protein